ncbi:MAG: hypothetical protein A4E53_03227 [Pelotomaculum sp. PtaB.Bin104]|nr:MAG: hypothetical protein A4E53_03227 [Pelotomaculum sp. PtaB.Bin104]
MNRQSLLALLVAGVITLTGCSQAAYNDPPPEEEEQEEAGYYDEDGHFHIGTVHSGGKSKLSTTSKGLGSSAKGSASS